jgi:hypothetical protein
MTGQQRGGGKANFQGIWYIILPPPNFRKIKDYSDSGKESAVKTDFLIIQFSTSARQ